MKWRFISTLLFICLIILLDWFNFFYWPKSFIQSISAPVLSVFARTNFGISKITIAFLSARQLEQENQQLKKENAQLSSRLVEAQDKEKENNFLRQQLSQKEEKAPTLLLTKIISKSPDNFSLQILIDKGERDGIKIGQAVIFENKILVGKVSKTYRKTSLVMLLNNNQFQTEIFTSESAVNGILKGNFNNLLVDFISKDKQLKNEELLITSGRDDLPRGLIAGKIQSFSFTSEQLFQNVTAVPMFTNIDSDNAFVVLDY